MGIRTEKITYNVNQRGRLHTGQHRCFDTAALAALINSPAMQERVSNGDIQGYYGHWPRLKFGMATQEGGLLDGQVVSLPIALKTVYLSADDKGNITHQEEFLDTAEGQLAQKMYESKAGGFSSAIDAKPGSFPSIATAFHAFDFVLAPNITQNRGYQSLMDSVNSADETERNEAVAVLDAAIAEEIEQGKQFLSVLDAANAEVATARAELAAAQEQAALLPGVRAELAAAQERSGLLDSVQAQMVSLTAALARASSENDLLVSRLAAMSSQEEQAVLDAVRNEGAIAPVRGGTTVGDFRRFKDMPLAQTDENINAPVGRETVIDQYLSRRA